MVIPLHSFWRPAILGLKTTWLFAYAYIKRTVFFVFGNFHNYGLQLMKTKSFSQILNNIIDSICTQNMFGAIFSLNFLINDVSYGRDDPVALLKRQVVLIAAFRLSALLGPISHPSLDIVRLEILCKFLKYVCFFNQLLY